MSIRTTTIFRRVLVGLIIASLIFVTWYKKTYSMYEATAYSVNTPEMPRSLLILTQGSEFKDSVTKKVVNYFSDRDVFIQVRDISSIPDVILDDWKVVLVMHTWEISRPPSVIQNLVDKGIDQSKFVFLTTSGNGESKIEGIDGITGASLPVTIDRLSTEVIESINQCFHTHAIMN